MRFVWALCGLVVLYPHGVVGELTLPTEALRRPPTAHRALHSEDGHDQTLLRTVGGHGDRAGGPSRPLGALGEGERQLPGPVLAVPVQGPSR